ncbi:MAG: hypothetical protein AB7I18_01490 [Candidatus Berkiella sp.]
MLNLPPIPSPPRFDSIAIDSIRSGNIQQALFAIGRLTASDNIEAVYQALSAHHHPDLWAAFLQNRNIQDPLLSIKNALYKNCHSYQENYFVAKHWGDVAWQIATISSVEPGYAFRDIFDDLLQSTDKRLWFAFIHNPAISLALKNTQYYTLVEKLIVYVNTQVPLDTDWVILLMLYLLKGYPLNYTESLLQFTQHFSLMLDYALLKIFQPHDQPHSKETRTEIVYWLRFIIKTSLANAEMNVLTRSKEQLKAELPALLQYLGSKLTYDFLQIFPECFPTALDHIHAQLLNNKNSAAYRGSVSLIKLLATDEKFCHLITTDSACHEALTSNLPPPVTPVRRESHRPFVPAFVTYQQQTSTTSTIVDAFAEVVDEPADAAQLTF